MNVQPPWETSWLEPAGAKRFTVPGVDNVPDLHGDIVAPQLVIFFKVRDGTTFLTQIDHRQTPMRILEGTSDVGPVWTTEALFQQQIGHPLGLVEIPETLNPVATYVAAQMDAAPHPEAAAAFFEFLTGEAGQAVYRQYGFMSPE